MTTNRIQPNDTIFVVDLQAEEIFEMTAGEFASNYSGLNMKINYDSNADAYCTICYDPTGGAMYSNFMPTYEDAADALFLSKFSNAANCVGLVMWFHTRAAAESNYLLWKQNNVEIAE